MLDDFMVCVQVKMVRKGAVGKTFVDKKPQGVWKQVVLPQPTLAAGVEGRNRGIPEWKFQR
jgi:hypothetical protein